MLARTRVIAAHHVVQIIVWLNSLAWLKNVEGPFQRVVKFVIQNSIIGIYVVIQLDDHCSQILLFILFNSITTITRIHLSHQFLARQQQQQKLMDNL